MNSVLVTGGSGAFGTAFAKYLLKKEGGPRKIILLSRGEYRQFESSKQLEPLDPNSRLRFIIGDVRDRDRLRRAMEDVDVVVHAAALKRIETGAYNPLEVTKTNVDGAVNVIEAAHDAGVKKVVALSSDKAYQPVSPYGLSKAMAECIFIAANNTRGNHGPRYAVCRYGNVWGSTGSVVPVWRAMKESGALSVPVTDPGCTRFFMRMQEAVMLVADTIEKMPSTIAIPTLPAYMLGDLAEAMEVHMDVKGLPAWEKKAESMDANNSSDTARRMTVSELRHELREK